MIMEPPLGSLLDTLGEELDAGAKAIQKARVRLTAWCMQSNVKRLGIRLQAAHAFNRDMPC